MMKLYILVVCIVIATNSFATDSSLKPSIAFVGMSMDYREYDTSGQILDSEESSHLDLTGLEMSLGYTILDDGDSSSQVKVNLMILNGKTVYKGSYIGSGLPYGSVISSTNNIVIDTDVLYKRSNFFKNNIEFSYGIGIGYHEWERSLSASQVEVYSWFSFRPLVEISTIVKERLSLGLTVEYQYGFDTKMTLSNPSLEFTLGGADILEVSFPISYIYNEKIDLFFEVTLQKQMIVESNVNSGYYEPESTAYNNYLKFGAGYKF